MDIHPKYIYQNCSDWELISMIVTPPHNEEAAVYLIYNRYSPLVTKIYFIKFGRNRFYLEDCKNDLFLHLKGPEGDWHPLSTYTGESKFGAWLSRVTLNLFELKRKYLIENKVITLSIDEQTPIQLPDEGECEYERQERRVLLLEAISLLSDRDQKFVILKRLEGYNSKEIAELLQKSWDKHGITVLDNNGKVVIPTPGYVDVRTQRAKENLKIIIAKLTK